MFQTTNQLILDTLQHPQPFTFGCAQPIFPHFVAFCGKSSENEPLPSSKLT